MIKNKTDIIGRTLTLIVVDVDDRDTDNTVVYKGVIRLNEDELFFTKEGKKILSIDSYFNRIKNTPDNLKNILLGSDFYLTLSIGNLPENQSSGDYIDIGLKWIDD